MPRTLELSALGHTWIFDLDGTLVKHNGYLEDGEDTLLDGVKEFMALIPEKDMILIVTSRKECWKEQTVSFLKKNGIRFHEIIFGAPFGERIVINDKKPGGLKTAVSLNVARNADLRIEVKENDKL